MLLVSEPTPVNHLKAVLLSKLNDCFSSLSGRVCCIEHLTKQSSRCRAFTHCVQPGLFNYYNNKHLTYCNLSSVFCEVLSHIIQRRRSTLSAETDNTVHNCHTVADYARV